MPLSSLGASAHTDLSIPFGAAPGQYPDANPSRVTDFRRFFTWRWSDSELDSPAARTAATMVR